jgi:hypothetical protein
LCATAGSQAELPLQKRRWWSRPLVALLYFLQPIVRGWARYQGRLAAPATSHAARETLDSEAMRLSGNSLERVSYLAGDGTGRMEFVAAVQERLEQQGWPHKADSGWNEYDLELQASRWANLRLVTATEDYACGKKMVHCRLRANWSLQAKTIFWITLGVELLLAGFAAEWISWSWLILLAMVPLAWFLTQEKRRCQSVMLVFLDQLAKDRKMIKAPPAGD